MHERGRENHEKLTPDVKIDVAVIGAGVIGLAVARELSLGGRDVFVFEAEPGIGLHTSSRNSEIIHSGIFNPPDSLKARSCVEGRGKIYKYAEEHGIKFKKLGKSKK